MSSTNFIDYQTPIPASWLNDVNINTYNSYINIMAAPYNAKMDGVTDDTAAFQAAINALSGGGTILVPAGKTAVINGNLTVNASSSIVIQGLGSTNAGTTNGSILNFTASGSTALISALSSFGFYFKNLYVRQTNPSFTGAVIDLSHGISNQDSAFASIKDNVFLMVSTSAAIINITKSIEIDISNNQFSGGSIAINSSAGAGFYSNVITIEKNQFSNQTTTPIFNAGTGSSVWNIQKNTFEQKASGAAGAVIMGQISGFTFIGNWCGDGNTSGTWLSLTGGVAGAIIEGNFFGNGAYGISTSTSTGSSNQGLIISGNVFSNIGTSDILLNGITAGDICNNFHYASASVITGTLTTGRYQLGAQLTQQWNGSSQFNGPIGFFGATPVSQITGYGTPTGGSHQSSFAAGSITLPNLAASVAQLIIDLKTLGLLGS